MRGKNLPAKFLNLDFKNKNKNKIIQMKDTVDHQSKPLLEVKNLTTRFTLKTHQWKKRKCTCRRKYKF